MSKILRKGSTGPEVEELQRQLNKYLKTPGLSVDGKFGDKTEKAVMQFQRAVGFRGKDIDGEVGPKTTLALCQLFEMKICGTLKPNAATTPVTPTTPTKPTTPPNLQQRNATGNNANTQGPKQFPPADAAKPKSPNDLPNRYQASAQFGYQYSKRDGPGLQAQLGFTFRSRDYFPNSNENSFYHGMHSETMIAPFVLGIPLGSSSIYTGQLSISVAPLTDWLVIADRLHLLTPSLGIYGQIPFNPGSDTTGTDTAAHRRVGGYAQLELFHVDLVKDKLSIGISGQESGYWDFHDSKLVWDPSVLAFLQGTFGWSKYRPLPKP